MSNLPIALLTMAFSIAAFAQGTAPSITAPSADAAAAAKEKQKQVESATQDKGHTQRAGDDAAKASGTGMSGDAKAARRAASRENVMKTTEDKGHTQRAGEAANKAAEEANKAAK